MNRSFHFRPLLLLLALACLGSCQRAPDPTDQITASDRFEAVAPQLGARVGEVEVVLLSGGATQLIIQVNGSLGTTTATLREGPWAEAGPVALMLSAPDPTGRSVTTMPADWPYSRLVMANAHVEVRNGSSQVLALADIGANALTGNQRVFPISPTLGNTIAGSFTIRERRGGTSQAEFRLTGTTAGQVYPTHIHVGGVCGAISVTLQDVDGTSGTSASHVFGFDGPFGRNNGAYLPYSVLLGYDACIKVHPQGNLNVTLARG
jgi:hypothetical protein